VPTAGPLGWWARSFLASQSEERTTETSTSAPLVARLAAGAGAAGFVLVAGFQIALAFGAPWGRGAWGGAHDVLPMRQRMASAVAAVVLVLGALFVLGRAGHWESSLPFGIFRWGTWALVAGMALSAFGNFASSSPWERFLTGPIALLLALLCLAVALWGPA
jgi:hypothetical protein